MNENYKFLPQLILRSPFYSYENYDLADLNSIIQKQDFKNALWLASPDFYQVLEKKSFCVRNLDTKEKFSLYKYYNRMSYRPTPFGSFSSFTCLNWTQENKVILADNKDTILHLRPDQQLIQRLSEFSKKYYTNYKMVNNPTLYRTGNELRFVYSTQNSKGESEFSLNALEFDKFYVDLIKLFKNGPLPADVLRNWIINKANASETEAEDFIKYMNEEQITYTQFEGAMIEGNGHLEANSICSNDFVSSLNDFWGNWRNKSFKNIGALPDVSNILQKLLECKNIKYGQQHFYSATERPIVDGGLGQEYQTKLEKIIHSLQHLIIPRKLPAFEKFRDEFSEKFDKEKIPLLTALDNDTGIIYANLSDAIEDSLFKNVRFPTTAVPNQIEWTNVHQLFLKLWLGNSNRDAFAPIVLTQENLDFLPVPDKNFLPPTMAVIFRTTKTKLLIEYANGASATSLIGRFSVFSEEVAKLCKILARKESANNPNILFADINQLSNSHVDNINRRRQIYDYEIPINVYAELPLDYQIKLNDLYIYIEGGELILESKSLAKRIIPRLTSAYNYQLNSLSIFRFLCDLQYQGIQSVLSFDLEALFPGLDFYPSVELEDAIISAAKWRFKEGDFSKLKNCSQNKLTELFSGFRKKHHLPKWVALGDSDQQLVFNLDVEEDIFFFMECLKKKKEITLKQFFLPDNSISAEEKPLVGQYIAFLEHEKEVYSKLNFSKRRVIKNKQRDFLLGSNWLYLKIYCTPQTANNVLLHVIQPVLRKNQNRIEKWFFIRYTDNGGYHLRFRVKGSITDLSLILLVMKEQLINSDEYKWIKDFQGDTYRRELERYGSDLIDQVEDFFCAGSELVMAFVKTNKKSDSKIESYLLSLVLTKQMINIAFKNIDKQIEFITHSTTNFLNQFHADKQLKTDLDNKYRSLKDQINEALGSNMLLSSLSKELQKRIAIVLEKWEILCRTKMSEQRLKALLSDLIHMQTNRLFYFKQRKHELIVYYFLKKYTISQKAKIVKNIKEAD